MCIENQRNKSGVLNSFHVHQSTFFFLKFNGELLQYKQENALNLKVFFFSSKKLALSTHETHTS